MAAILIHLASWRDRCFLGISPVKPSLHQRRLRHHMSIIASAPAKKHPIRFGESIDLRKKTWGLGTTMQHIISFVSQRFWKLNLNNT